MISAARAQAAASDRRLSTGQTDGRTPDRYTDSAPHTMHTALIIFDFAANFCGSAAYSNSCLSCIQGGPKTDCFESLVARIRSRTPSLPRPFATPAPSALSICATLRRRRRRSSNSDVIATPWHRHRCYDNVTYTRHCDFSSSIDFRLGRKASCVRSATDSRVCRWTERDVVAVPSMLAYYAYRPTMCILYYMIPSSQRWVARSAASEHVIQNDAVTRLRCICCMRACVRSVAVGKIRVSLRPRQRDAPAHTRPIESLPRDIGS